MFTIKHTHLTAVEFFRPYKNKTRISTIGQKYSQFTAMALLIKAIDKHRLNTKTKISILEELGTCLSIFII